MKDSGKRRALVIASQTGTLRGCDNDAVLMAGLLRDNGFDVRPLSGSTATRAGILGAYEDLIQASRPRDAALVSFAGHGSLTTLTGTTVQEPAREVRCLVPFDIEETNPKDFRGVLADELSVLQWRLTLKTVNTTTILDCCHAGRMSRGLDDGETQVRAVELYWPERAVRHRLRTAEREFGRVRAEHPDAAWFDANPLAVRLVACGPHEEAHEWGPRSGPWYGVFTRALVDLVRENPRATWQTIGDLARYRVVAERPRQRPDVDGPTDRVVFTLDQRPPGRTLPIQRDERSGRAWIDGAHLHDLRVGDTFVLTAPGGVPTARTNARLVRVTQLTRSGAMLSSTDGRKIPDGSTAYDDGAVVRDVPIRVHGPGAETVRSSVFRSGSRGWTWTT